MGGVHFETGLAPWGVLRSGRQDWLEYIGVRGHPILLSRGRDCLYLIAKILDLKPEDQVLLPAFICGELVETLQSWGIHTVFYDINRDLTLSIEQIEACMTHTIKAVVYVNYYGFRQPVSVLQALRTLGVPIIEDCCQSPFLATEGAAWPDFAITSLRKYLPVPDGSVLDVISDKWQPKAREVHFRAPSNISLVFWRMLALALRRIQERRDRRVWSIVSQELFSHAERALRNSKVPMRMHSLSRRIAAGCDVIAVRQRRRDNYEATVSLLKKASSVTPVIPNPPGNACPYGCPIIVSDNKLWVDALNYNGVEAAILWEGPHIEPKFASAYWLSKHIAVLPVAQGNAVARLREAVSVACQYGELAGDDYG